MIKEISILFVLTLLTIPTLAETTYYCDIFQNTTGTYCLPIQNRTIEQNNVSNNIAIEYNNSIVDLGTIISFNGTANATQLTFAVKREAQIQLLILKFLRVIYGLLTYIFACGTE